MISWGWALDEHSQAIHKKNLSTGYFYIHFCFVYLPSGDGVKIFSGSSLHDPTAQSGFKGDGESIQLLINAHRCYDDRSDSGVFYRQRCCLCFGIDIRAFPSDGKNGTGRRGRRQGHARDRLGAAFYHLVRQRDIRKMFDGGIGLLLSDVD